MISNYSTHIIPFSLWTSFKIEEYKYTIYFSWPLNSNFFNKEKNLGENSHKTFNLEGDFRSTTAKL